MSSSLQRNLVNRIHNGSITARLLVLCSSFLLLFQYAAAQHNTPVFKDAIAANRSKTYNNIVKNIITKNLSLPLTDSTEENWQDAFYAMEVLQYKELWVLEKIKVALDSVEIRSFSFQRALMELLYSNYPLQYKEQVFQILGKTIHAKIFAMAAVYLIQENKENYGPVYMTGLMRFPVFKMLDSSKNTDVLLEVMEMEATEKKILLSAKKVKEFFKSGLSIGNTIIYSIQRKNRNYPGIAFIRDSTGKFITDSSGNIFSVPQLARSITNLPGYLTNGNTPQGIFRMNGFAVSRSAAIGPTENIQLMMPYETSPQYFLNDSSITDTVWTKELYERLLPPALKNYHPLYGTYYASAIGRTEIIAHGTTVDPDYYKGQTYYPHTPTQGCLCTKEIWSSIDGKRTESNQQKLVDALKKQAAPTAI